MSTPAPEHAHEVGTLTTQLARDLENLNSHGPQAPGLRRRIELTRERLEQLGVPVEEQPC